ncbi:GNAT family N-acetyltransferase [Roseateles toxinivorans]|uniref:Acetyltransferase (GNAT) family protein n=1 Tax=Roseateles toxinivorans TaxID=270368 RepID=A0A4R6QEJ1_9BURK|nr:GNAT family N-acetyltransferase [Roseateles toxinivorans]TDP60647.1 acetyltransferase (GNAT) family protein [Roseateles toxinivorans]
MTERSKKTFKEVIADRLGRWSFDAPSPFATGAVSEVRYRDTKTLTLRLAATDLSTKVESNSYLVSDSDIQRFITAANALNVSFGALGFNNSLFPADQIQAWIDEEIVLILVQTESNKTESKPIAFIKVTQATDRPHVVEIGPVLVPDLERKRGFGQAIFNNVAQLLALSLKGCRIYARVSPSNQLAIELFDDLKRFKAITEEECFDDVEALPEYCVTNINDFKWYIWESLGRSRGVTFGDVFKGLREVRRLTQQIVAQRAEMTREALNQIEHGVTPSPENIPRLLEALSSSLGIDTYAKTKLLYSVCGYELPPDLIFSGVLESQPSNRGIGPESRWSVSDRPLEFTSESEFASSIAAISQGFQRFFFVPRNGLLASYGGMLIRKILEETDSLGLTERQHRDLLTNVRLFVAPSTTCRMRLNVLGADYKEGILRRPRGISMIGPNDERIDLDASLTQSIFEDISDAIRPALNLPPSHNKRLDLQDGFAMIPLAEVHPELIARLYGK